MARQMPVERHADIANQQTPFWGHADTVVFEAEQTVFGQHSECGEFRCKVLDKVDVPFGIDGRVVESELADQ